MKNFLILIVLLASLIAGCGGSRVVADPNVNNQRLNGLTPILVYETPAYYATRSYQVICQIEPFKYFTTGESDSLLVAWRKVSTAAGDCQGWAYVP